MTDLEREDFRQFNGQMINELCALGDQVLESYGLEQEIVAGLPRWQWREFDATKDYHE